MQDATCVISGLLGNVHVMYDGIYARLYLEFFEGFIPIVQLPYMAMTTAELGLHLRFRQKRRSCLFADAIREATYSDSAKLNV